MKSKPFALLFLIAALALFLSACGSFEQVTKGKPIAPPPEVIEPPPPPPVVEAPAPVTEKTLPPPAAPKKERFPDVLVHIAPALICVGTDCHHALVGPATPRGEFQLTHYSTPDPGYGGDILAFKETAHDLYAIHRVINVRGQQRLARLKSMDPKRRNGITGGCINVDPLVYDRLVKCCYASKLIID